MPGPNNLRIVLYAPIRRGGIAQYTYQLAESLACKGTNITVITTEDYELQHLKRNFELYIPFTKSWVKIFLDTMFSPFRKKGIGHIVNPNVTNIHHALNQQKHPVNLLLKISRLWLIWIKIIFFLLWKSPNIIHFQWLIDKNTDFYFMKILKTLGFTIVYTAHDLLPHDGNSQIDRNIYRKIYCTSDKIIVHSENSKKDIVEMFKIDQSKVYVIPHGSYDLFYTDKKTTKSMARKKIGIPDGKKVILFFGLIRRYKGLEYLVSAYQKIKGELDNTILLIVGNIHNRNSEDFKFYSALIDQISHDDDIICVNEYIPLEKIDSYFLVSDLVVLPYTKTYTSGVLLAAYAAGRPAIVTDTGALSEVVDSGKSGFIVPPKDVNALAQAIMKTVSDPEQMKEMGNYAKYLSGTVYSWSNIASKTINVYDQSLHSRLV